MDERRVRILKQGKLKKGTFVYWMDRDQRIDDNWALFYAQRRAMEKKVPVCVVVCISPDFTYTLRHFDFMLRGLKDTELMFIDKNIHFYILKGRIWDSIPQFIREINAGGLIADFSPLRQKKEIKKRVAENIDIPFYEVDTHNIVPCWIASTKQEYAAYTFRPKIKRLLRGFLGVMPKLKKHPYTLDGSFQENNWEELINQQNIDRRISVVDTFIPGSRAAFETLSLFIKENLRHYDKYRNDPLANCLSNLSPYLHFGHISPQRVALEVIKSNAPSGSKYAFLEELIVRRELSDNFCFYNDAYDNFNGFPEWAQKTLDKHKNDRREYLYSVKEFDKALTHDELWNAAQIEMLKTGKMHGYMRMYWAKKILEWTESTEEALEIAIYLNDLYSLDGCDPNGYTGIAWSIGGVHDRAWNEREVFGKVRYMSYGGCKSKFDIKKYIEKIKSLK